MLEQKRLCCLLTPFEFQRQLLWLAVMRGPSILFINYSLIIMISNFRTAWMTLESNGVWIQEMEHFMVLRLVTQHFSVTLGWTEMQMYCRQTIFSNCVILLHRLILKSKMQLVGTINVLPSSLTSSCPFGLILLMLGEWLSWISSFLKWNWTIASIICNSHYVLMLYCSFNKWLACKSVSW